MFQVFHVFRTYVVSVLFGCYIRFVMATYVFPSIFKCLQVFQTYVVSVLALFGHMLQVFYLDIAKVDMVLHMLQWDPRAVTALL